MIVLLNYLIINILIILNYQKLVKFIGVYDFPDKNLKLHKEKTPILGGVIILINYIFFCIGNLFNQDSLFLNSNLIEVISLIFLALSFLQ